MIRIVVRSTFCPENSGPPLAGPKGAGSVALSAIATTKLLSRAAMLLVMPSPSQSPVTLYADATSASYVASGLAPSYSMTRSLSFRSSMAPFATESESTALTPLGPPLVRMVT